MDDLNQFLVEKEIEFDAGHRVPSHKGKCRNPHGHRYRVVVGVVGDLHAAGGSDEGMVIDFGDIKEAMTKYIHDVHDHGFIMYGGDDAMRVGFYEASFFDEPDFKIIQVPFVPTAENLAKHFWEIMTSAIHGVAYVKVYETPTSMAVYPVQRVQAVVVESHAVE